MEVIIMVVHISQNPKCSHLQTLLFLFVLFGVILQGSDGVKDVQLQAARYARRGEDLRLRCNYDLETDSLYAVKWYRGSEEFYRFIPKESPPKQAFPIPGIVVNVNKSDEHNVFLKNISFETDGRFKCVISAEGTFQTLENAKDFDVVVIDYNSPKLFLDKMNYQPGDHVRANCTIERTYPSPNITWFINGKQVNNISVVTRVEPAVDDGDWRRGIGKGVMMGPYGYYYTTPTTSTTMSTTSSPPVGNNSNSLASKLSSTVSTLYFPISSYSPLTIKCMGQLYDVYNETSSILIQPKAPMIYPYSTVSTPRSQRNYGMMASDQQQHNFNSTPFSNGSAQFTPNSYTALMLILLLTSVSTSSLYQLLNSHLHVPPTLLLHCSNIP